MLYILREYCLMYYLIKQEKCMKLIFFIIRHLINFIKIMQVLIQILILYIKIIKK